MSTVRPLIRRMARELEYGELREITGGIITLDGTTTGYTGTGYPESDCDAGWDFDAD